MTDREKNIVSNIDRLSDECISYLEKEFSKIPNIGLFNVELIVIAFLMEYMKEERDFEGLKMQKFLTFYENYFLNNRCDKPRKSTIFNLKNDEIDSKNLVPYLKFEKMGYAEKRQYFIRTLSNMSMDIKKFTDSTKNFNSSSKIHFPYLALVNVYVNPLFCYEIPIKDYNNEIRLLSFEIENSNLELRKFLIVFSKMWIEIISKYFEHNSIFLSSIEFNFD